MAASKSTAAAAHGFRDVSPIDLVLPGYGTIPDGWGDTEYFVGHFPAGPEISDVFVCGRRPKLSANSGGNGFGSVHNYRADTRVCERIV